MWQGAWLALLLMAGVTLLCALLMPRSASAATNAPLLQEDEVTAAASGASQIEIPVPPNSGSFGAQITVLPNGNFVATDPDYDDGSGRTGIVYLYDGATHAVVSALRVNRPGDFGTSIRVTVLADGNFVVANYLWDSATVADVGAVRWCSADTGCSGNMAAANSLVGSSIDDMVGESGITPLPNGGFVVASKNWDNGAAAAAGAVTFCPAGGCIGSVSAANSLLGSSPSDFVGNGGIYVLENGNFVVSSFSWDNGGLTNLGAATWCSGTTGCPSTITSANSLVGSQAIDQVSNGGITPLDGGKYLVRSPFWANGGASYAGAVTPCSGNGGCTGTISSANSLVGAQSSDYVGTKPIARLSNGGHVVPVPYWNNGATADAGAVFFCSAGSACTGIVSSANSLVGSTANDQVGNDVVALPSGHYVVTSPYWNNGTDTQAGAVTWCNGATGCLGTVSAANSLFGATSNDAVGNFGIVVLSNGNYVVTSLSWDNGGLADLGALTWCSGTTGCPPGPVTTANSLVGASADDYMGVATPLAGGGYVALSSLWDDAGTEDVGLAFACLSPGGCTGTASGAASLRGSAYRDYVGDEAVALANGNYVVVSPSWDNGALSDVGAVTWCNRAAPCAEVVSASNSLIGSHAGDTIGSSDVTALPNGHYVVFSEYWSDGTRTELGAVTLGDGRSGTTGTISAANSVLGNIEGQGYNMRYVWNATHNYLIVALPDENRLVLATLAFALDVQLGGTGSGLVQSSPSGLTCAAGICEGAFLDSTVVTLTATPAASSSFSGWSGACTGTGPCVVTMDQAQTVQANFTLNRYALNVGKEGNEQGRVLGTGIDCGSDCTELFDHGTVVTLTATAEVSSDFVGWGGACTGTGPCVVLMNGPRIVSADFRAKQSQVTLPANVPGGRIDVSAQSPLTAAEANAPAATYPYGTLLRFTALPAPGYIFGNWTGNLSGSQNPQEVTLTGPLNVGATFVATGAIPPSQLPVQVYLPTINK